MARRLQQQERVDFQLVVPERDGLAQCSVQILINCAIAAAAVAHCTGRVAHCTGRVGNQHVGSATYTWTALHSTGRLLLETITAGKCGVAAAAAATDGGNCSASTGCCTTSAAGGAAAAGGDKTQSSSCSCSTVRRLSVNTNALRGDRRPALAREGLVTRCICSAGAILNVTGDPLEWTVWRESTTTVSQT